MFRPGEQGYLRADTYPERQPYGDWMVVRQRCGTRMHDGCARQALYLANAVRSVDDCAGRAAVRGRAWPRNPAIVASTSGACAHPASQNANPESLVEGLAISLAARHAKVRREGYAR